MGGKEPSPACMTESVQPHCHLLQTRDLQVIVGDASRKGVGGPQYCGIWSLTSRIRQFNAFGNSYAGLLPGEIRGKSPKITLADSHSCAMSRAAGDDYPVDAAAEYRIREPYYIDHALRFTDRSDMRKKGCMHRETGWCCYMNCPEDIRLNFLSKGEWTTYISPKHGMGSSVAPAYVPEDDLEKWPEMPEGSRHFSWDWAPIKFDQPFYYGRLGEMALILIFDNPKWLRFFCSPTGGNRSLREGENCPAWDFRWTIPESDYQTDKEYEFRMRLVYKPFVSNDDVLQEVKTAQAQLNFETV